MNNIGPSAQRRRPVNEMVLSLAIAGASVQRSTAGAQMRRRIERFLKFGLASLALFPLLSGAASSSMVNTAWYGTWKLDRSQSHLTAPPLTISRTPKGYHFDFGATSFDIGDDGKDYPTVPSRTTSLKALGERQWLRIHKVAGQEVDRSRLTISPDGRELLIETSASDPRGQVRRKTDRELRIGTGQGLAGIWQSTAVGLNVAEEIRVDAATGGRMRRSFPGEGESYTVLPGGPAVQYAGPRAVPGVTVALTVTSATEMHWIESIQGKPYTQGVDVLLADGRRMSETTWPVAQPRDRQVAAYVKR